MGSAHRGSRLLLGGAAARRDVEPDEVGLLRVGSVCRAGRADGGACVVGLEARHGEGQRILTGGGDQARLLADLLGDVAPRGEILGLLLLRGLRARGGSSEEVSSVGSADSSAGAVRVTVPVSVSVAVSVTVSGAGCSVLSSEPQADSVSARASAVRGRAGERRV